VFLHRNAVREPRKEKIENFPGSFFLEICLYESKKNHFFPNICMSFEDDSVDCDFADFVETFQCPKCHCTLAILVPDSVQDFSNSCPQSMESAQPASSPANAHRAASLAGLRPTQRGGKQ